MNFSFVRPIRPLASRYYSRFLKPSVFPRRIIFGSCSDSSENLGYWDSFHRLKPDSIVLMGDNVYGGRDQYERLSQETGFQNCIQDEIPILATVDDNDLRESDSRRAFCDFFHPILPSKTAVYQSYNWMEDGLQIILLDVRHESSETSFLGEKQWQWLRTQLQTPARLRILVSPIQVLSQAHSYDSWNDLPAEREQLLDALSNALILSGDRHASALYYDTESDIYEITCSSLTHTVSPGTLDGEVDPLRLSDFCYTNNFGLLEFREEGVVVSIRDATTADVLMEWSWPYRNLMG